MNEERALWMDAPFLCLSTDHPLSSSPSLPPSLPLLPPPLPQDKEAAWRDDIRAKAAAIQAMQQQAKKKSKK
jgi:hypothetical protein